MQDFYRIVRPVILPQLAVASFTIIALSYIITLVIRLKLYYLRKV